MSRGAFFTVLSALILGSLWPWYTELFLWPMAPDSATWIERASTSDPGWFDWTFRTSHFDVGWRPLTALSFTLNRTLFGLEPLGYRVTDLVLHGLTAAALACTARRLTPELPPWSAWLVALVFLAHPVTDEVVPFLARRSYPLGALLGLAAWLVYLRPADGSRSPRLERGRSLLAGLLLALAIAANEVSVLFAVALPFAALARGAPLAAVARSTAVLALLPIALVLARTSVVGGLGGYELPEDTGDRTWPVFVAAWRELAGIARATALPEALGWLLLVVSLPYYVIRALLERGTKLVLLLWVAAHPLLYAGQGVWFPRQAYVATVPLALLVGLMLSRTLSTESTLLRTAHMIPQLALVFALTLSSPLVRGPEPARIAERVARNDLINAALADLLDPAGSAQQRTRAEREPVHLVLPFAPPVEREDALRARAAQRELSRASRLPARWLATYLEARGGPSEPLEFVYVLADGEGPLATPAGGSVRVRPGSPYYVAEPRKRAAADGDAEARPRPRMVRHDEQAERDVPIPSGRAWIAPTGS